MAEHASRAGSMTPNPQLLQRIQDLPLTLDRLKQEHGIRQMLSTIDNTKKNLKPHSPRTASRNQPSMTTGATG